MNIKDLETNLPDNSVKEFTDILVGQLELYSNKIDTITDYQHGKKQMLEEIIQYITLIKPN